MTDNNHNKIWTFRNISLLTITSILSLYLISQAIFKSDIDTPIRADARIYFIYAHNIHNHNLYSRSTDSQNLKPDAFVTPGYPLFLSLFMDGTSVKNIILNVTTTQMLLSVFSLPLLYLVFCKFLPIYLTIPAVILTAISPHLINMNIYLLTESLFTVLLIITIFLISSLNNNKLITPLLAGLILGYASLTRPSLQYFIIILIPFLWFSLNKTQSLKTITTLFIGFIIIFGSWTARNYIVTGHTSDPTLAKVTLIHGMYPDMMYNQIPESRGMPYRYDPQIKTITTNMDTALTEISRRFQEETLRHTKWYLIGKPLTFWSWNILAGMGDVFIYPVTKSPYFNNKASILTHEIMYYLHWPLLILAFVGCCIAWLPKETLKISKESLFVIRLISLLLIYYTALHMVAAPFPRYSIPLRPFVYGIALFPILILARKKGWYS